VPEEEMDEVEANRGVGLVDECSWAGERSVQAALDALVASERALVSAQQRAADARLRLDVIAGATLPREVAASARRS
jgi:hypothetical protein